MRIFNRIFVVFFLAVLTLSGGAAEVRRTLLAEDATQGWELPANVRMAGSEFMIPAGSGGEVLSPRFSLPKPRQEMMIGFEFRTSPEFEPGRLRLTHSTGCAEEVLQTGSNRESRSCSEGRCRRMWNGSEELLRQVMERRLRNGPLHGRSLNRTVGAAG